MFAALSPQPADPLLALIGLFQADQRPDKIDLGVGVYRDDEGKTPVCTENPIRIYRMIESAKLAR
jgi:aromatic-amino-acid transaminase